MNGDSRVMGRRARLAGSAMAVVLFAAACGSSGGSGGGGTNAAAAGGSSPTTGSSSANSAVTVESHSGPMGTYLTDAGGKTLYMFAADSATKSNCSGACASFWPPLTAKGAVHGSGGVASGKFTTIARSDGSKQVVYDGHPLYYFKEDSAAGDTNGQGIDQFGGKWWLLGTSGSPITGASSSSSSSSSSSGGGGGGGWG